MSAPLPLVLLHFFGSSRREWSLVSTRFSTNRRTLALDLPGFGDAADENPADVAGMADQVDRCIAAAGLSGCVLVGHSMSAKVAALLAARAPSYLRGLVLVTASPPSPEPMSAASRRKLLAFDGSRCAAAAYIDGITANRLPDALREIAIVDAMRASLAAWRRWVTHGSQEDCSSSVGVLSLPALVVAGAGDPSLGKEIQCDRVMPHCRQARLAVIDGGHALPFENPDALHREIEGFVATLD